MLNMCMPSNISKTIVLCIRICTFLHTNSPFFLHDLLVDNVLGCVLAEITYQQQISLKTTSKSIKIALGCTTKQPHCHLICFAYSVLLLQQLSANLPRTNDIWIVSCYCQKCHIALATRNKLSEPEDVLLSLPYSCVSDFVTAKNNPSACHIA